MTDSASSILLQRIQSVGSNVNLWGGYVNTNLETLERAAKGYEALAVTGDATISWTNYSASNTGAVARLKLTGSLAASATLTFPAYQNYVSVHNAAGATVTIKCSGGTGVAIPNGQTVLIYCDGTDYSNAGPTIGPTGTQNTSTYAYAQWGAVESAIANAGIPASAGTVLVSGTDTTAGYLGAKMTVNFGSTTTTQISGLTSLELSVQNSGAAEKVLVTVGEGYVGGFLNGGLQSAQFTPSVGSAYDCDFTSASWTVDLSGMTTPQLGQRISLNCFGNNQPFLLGTVNGLTNLYLDPGFSGELTYSGSSWGWN